MNSFHKFQKTMNKVKIDKYNRELEYELSIIKLTINLYYNYQYL